MAAREQAGTAVANPFVQNICDRERHDRNGDDGRWISRGVCPRPRGPCVQVTLLFRVSGLFADTGAR
jgi:hypothetical protein